MVQIFDKERNEIKQQKGRIVFFGKKKGKEDKFLFSSFFPFCWIEEFSWFWFLATWIPHCWISPN